MKNVMMKKEILNMKTLKVIVMCVSMGWTSSAFTQVDIDKKMKLLEKNVENAQSNFNQFKENLVISVKNFNEATRVVNELRALKKQAVRDTKRAESNSLVLGQVIGKYTEYVAQEESNILKEQEAVKKLETLILSIKENSPLDERKKWMGKKEVYKKETKKWSRESKNAKKTLLTFEKLRD